MSISSQKTSGFQNQPLNSFFDTKALIKPQKKLGQVFLKKRIFLNKIIKAGEINPSDVVLEIGAGTGILTAALLKTGAKVIAIEKDSKMIRILQNKFNTSKNLTIIQADIRDFLKKPNLILYQKNIKNYKIIGNIPYYLTSYLIKLILSLPKQPQIIILMVQKEVAQRIVAQPPNMNILALSIQFFAQPKIITIVPKTAFWPQPKVDSALIQLIPYNNKKQKIISPSQNSIFANNKNIQSFFFQIIRAGFSHPRKLLISNLKNYFSYSTQELQDIFTNLNLNLNIRPQELSLKQWQDLTWTLFTLFKDRNII